MSKKDDKVNELHNEFERIQNDNKDIDINKYLAKIEDLPDLGDIQIYDYDKDMDKAVYVGEKILESLVEMYLGDYPEIYNHPYIQNKMREDAQVYAETIFLSKMTRKNLMTQMRLVDSGDSSARLHEVINQTFAQVRENAKFSATQKSDLEKFYAKIREDFGLKNLSESSSVNVETESDDDVKIIDTSNLNNMIDNYLKNNKK